MLIKTEQREDQLFLKRWLSDPIVPVFYEGRDHPFHMAMVNQKFYGRHDNVTRCIIIYENFTIGYVQFYPVDDDIRKIGHYNIGYGMDQFIGEPEYWNQGIGTLLVMSMVKFLTKKKQADIIVIDPKVTYKRALKCYAKCGFIPVTILPTHEWHEGKFHDCLLMENRIK